MSVLDEMDHVTKRHLPASPGGAGIGQDLAKLLEPGDDAVVVAIARRVVGRRDRHVDEVPGRAAGNALAVLIGPGRGVGQRLAGLEQVADGGPRLRASVASRPPGSTPDAPCGPTPGPAALDRSPGRACRPAGADQSQQAGRRGPCPSAGTSCRPPSSAGDPATLIPRVPLILTLEPGGDRRSGMRRDALVGLASALPVSLASA